MFPKHWSTFARGHFKDAKLGLEAPTEASVKKEDLIDGGSPLKPGAARGEAQNPRSSDVNASSNSYDESSFSSLMSSPLTEAARNSLLIHQHYNLHVNGNSNTNLPCKTGSNW